MEIKDYVNLPENQYLDGLHLGGTCVLRWSIEIAVVDLFSTTPQVVQVWNRTRASNVAVIKSESK